MLLNKVQLAYKEFQSKLERFEGLCREAGGLSASPVDDGAEIERALNALFLSLDDLMAAAVVSPCCDF